MKNHLKLAFVFTVVLALNLNAQYGDLGIREKFDNVYASLYQDAGTNIMQHYGITVYRGVPEGLAAEDPLDLQAKLGDYASALEALLIMYEATCDRDYLDEFLRNYIPVLSARADFAEIDGAPASDYPITFFDNVALEAKLLHASAHYVHLIGESSIGWVEGPDFYGYNLPTTDPEHWTQQDFDAIGHPFMTYDPRTYAEFATLFNDYNKLTMNHLIENFWRGGNECFCKPVSGGIGCPNTDDYAYLKSCKDSECPLPGSEEVKSISELGAQAPFGTALIYIYLANPNDTQYGVHAVEMARAYLIQNGGILKYNPTHKAYTWHHDGWQAKRANQNSPWVRETDDIENIAYGAWDISFPLLYNKYYDEITGTITGNQYFEDYQMVRFRNTFTRLIYNYTAPSITNTYNYGTTFFMNVDGTNTPTSTWPANTLQSVAQSSAKSWINLYRFDNVPGTMGTNNVYNILMDYYIGKEADLPATSANFGGIKIVGLAQMCKANYDVEGVVSPECDPDTNAPDPNDSGRIGRRGKSSQSAVNVFPNPAMNEINISLEEDMRNVTEETPAVIKIRDITGKLLLTTNKTSHIDVSTFPRGVYFIEVTTRDKSLKKTFTLK